jgi:hypothetical protein
MVVNVVDSSSGENSLRSMVMVAKMGTFDSAASSLRELLAALRMTGLERFRMPKSEAR